MWADDSTFSLSCRFVLIFWLGFCSNELYTGAPLVTSTGCTFTCDSDPTQICGGANALDLYLVPGAPLPNSAATSTPAAAAAPSSTSTSTLTSTSTSSASLPTETVPSSEGPYSFLGCYAEPANSFALIGSGTSYGTGIGYGDDIVSCEAYCYCNSPGAPYTYFYVEYYGQCT